MTSRRRQLFEELGLTTGEAPTNPYNTLGLDPEFARKLLQEDPTGAALKTVTSGLHRALSKIYHTDREGADPAKYDEVVKADQKINLASGSALLRWSRAERPGSVPQAKKMQEQQAALLGRAANILQTTVELGQHPHHFSQLHLAQGVLMRRGARTLLMRSGAEDGVQIIPGTTTALNDGNSIKAVDRPSHAFDFRSFMNAHDSFGIEPETDIVTYVNERGRTSILRPDLTFMMDITDPVADYRRRRQAASNDLFRQKGSLSDLWLRTADPLLYISRIPAVGDYRDSTAQIVQFTSWLGPKRSGKSLARELTMEAAGSVGDPNFYNKVRNDRVAGALALSGTGASSETSYFNTIALPSERLIELGIDYSPLMTTGNSLLLRDISTNLPVVTDAQVVGMIGSNIRAK